LPPELVDVATGARQAICIDCGDAFALDARRRDRSLPAPQRCPGCRARRLAERNAANLAAHRAGRTTAPRPRPEGETDPAARRTWPSACADCGRAIRLAFRPRADRPHWCRACWEARNGQ